MQNSYFNFWVDQLLYDDGGRFSVQRSVTLYAAMIATALNDPFHVFLKKACFYLMPTRRKKLDAVGHAVITSRPFDHVRIQKPAGQIGKNALKY